jgi:hypothetical protein
MKVNTITKNHFTITDVNSFILGSLTYTNNSFGTGILTVKEQYALCRISIGNWQVYTDTTIAKKTKTKIKIEAGGFISIQFMEKRNKYQFRKSNGLKLRFFLLNKNGEELLSITATVNWKKETHDYILQLNEEFEKECDSFLILHAVHCANCSLSMLTGGKVPALVSI